MRIMVIGASGFLGGHVRGRARAAGMTVVTAGRSELPGSPGHWRVNLAADDPAEIADVLRHGAFDAVVNCSGATAGAPDTLVTENLTGTYALVKAMLMAGGPGRLVHLGSAAEYGVAEPGVPVTELVRPRPATLYGVTKLAGTRLVELAVAAGLDAVVLRVFNPVGPGAPASSLPGRLVGELRRALSHGTEVRLGPLDAVRDFVDARDVADAVLAAAAAGELSYRLLNIGSGRGVPARELVRQLVAISGHEGVVHEDAPEPARSAGTAWQQADITRAARELAWEPRRELPTSLTDLWEASR